MGAPLDELVKLPPKEQVVRRNRTITAYYAQLYRARPQLFKWAGMAAFASFHVGEKLKLWNWDKSGIKPFSASCDNENRSLEDDFQIIRVINNEIFGEIGVEHLQFIEMDFADFEAMLAGEARHRLVVEAFGKLDEARTRLARGESLERVHELVWSANMEILRHEQAKVVQPLFDRLSDLFSGAMSFLANFDYSVNHSETGWQTSSRFVWFMLTRALRHGGLRPDVTRLDHRWHWIENDVVPTWRKVEATGDLMAAEIEYLARIEPRQLIA